MESLLQLAMRFGPFFFSLYLFQKVWRWSSQEYKKSLDHQPPLDQADIRMQRIVWVASFTAGLVLVGISVWWWVVFYNQRTYFFVGHIRNLHDYEKLDSDDLYFHAKLKYYMAGGLLRNEDFLFVQSKPFAAGQQFDLLYSKSGTDQTQLTVIYDPSNPEPTYDIEFDGTKNKLSPVTQKVSRPKPNTSWLIPTVHAQEASTQSADRGKPKLGPPSRRHESQDSQLLSAVSSLQKESTPVPLKIEAIKEIQDSDPNKVKELLAQGDEPLALTLFDLSRHSDPELAYRATAVSKEVDIDEFLLEELSSTDSKTRRQAEQILLRISRSHALSLISKVNAKSPDLLETKTQIQTGKSIVLQPTGTSQGDRYYVQATWDSAQTSTVNCLTELFNKELETDRTLEQEKQLMNGKSQRYVYWYSKAWAIDMASRIRSCGAQAAFVKPY